MKVNITGHFHLHLSNSKEVVILWESAINIYAYVEQNEMSVEDLDIQVHVYVFPMTKDLLAYCKESDYRFLAIGSGDDVDTLMSYPHYNFTYTDIDSLEWVTNCTEETKFSVGTCASAGFNFSIFSEKYLDDGTCVNYENVAFKAAVVIPVYDFSYNDTLIIQKQLGVFHVTEYEEEAGMINFTCLDNMRFMDKKASKIANFITVPLKTDALMANILTKVNLIMGEIPSVKYFQVNKVDHLKKLTYRTIFGYAMEPIGAFAYADYMGNICARCFNASNAAVVTIPYDEVIENKSSGDGVKINGYEIQYGDNMVAGFSYSSGEEEIEVPVPLTVDNPLFIKKKQDSLEIIGNRLDSRMYGFTFEPYEVTTFLPNFYIEAGDFVNVEDKNGVMHKILVSQLTWRDNLEMEIVSACETEGDESSSYDSDVNEAIQKNESIDSIALDDDTEESDPFDNVEVQLEYEYTLDTSSRTILLTKYIGSATEVYVPSRFIIDSIRYSTVIANNGSWYSYTTFGGNTQIKEVYFQDGVKFNNNDMSFAFYLCTALEKVSNLPNTVTNLYYAFANCTSMINPPELPSAAGNLDGAFHKSGLVKMPELPNSVWDMFHAFSYCSSLVELTEIPENVKVVNSMFRESPKIHGTITLKGAITDYNEYTFYSPNYEDTYSLIVNYSSVNASIVDYLINNSSNPNVKKGVCID